MQVQRDIGFRLWECGWRKNDAEGRSRPEPEAEAERGGVA